MAAGYPETDVIQRGINLIMSRQKAWGEWKQEEIEGGNTRHNNLTLVVFNKTCMISYPNYKFIFPIWALGRFGKRYEQEA
jgi:lanosterol synthase